MLIRGRWIEIHDDLWVPTCEVVIRTADTQQLKVDFLLDTGADQSLLSADVANALKVPMKPQTDRLFGVGAPIDVLFAETTLYLPMDDGREAKFNSIYACCTDPNALDMSVLGRDVLNEFAVIVDRRNDAILLLRERHSYRVQTT
jgi:hypothetical protein